MKKVQSDLAKFRFLCQAAPNIQVPEPLRVAFGWETVAIDRTGSRHDTKFVLDQTKRAKMSFHIKSSLISAMEKSESLFFRICIACDVREIKKVDVVLAESGTVIQTFDIRYAYVLQIFEVAIANEWIEAFVEEGLILRMVEGKQPLWIFYHPSSDAMPITLQPHLVVDGEGDRTKEFFSQLRSVASIQPFGWLEGCVLDGLLDLERAFPNYGWRETIEAHLKLFFPLGDRLVMENHSGSASDDTFYSTESTLPIAIIAQLWPEHSIIDRAIEFWTVKREVLKTEDCYTMAYPIAVVAKLRGDDQLADLAVRLLHEQMEGLAEEDGLWLRFIPELPEAERFYNWARSFAWYMLGFVRTNIVLREMTIDLPGLHTLEQEVVRVAKLAISHQQENGLWNSFIDDPATGVDTSGSAGIATALALGVQHQLLPDSAMVAAKRTYEALQSYLTVDGLLTGVTQNNRGGEALQRSDYRVISQMAMGLMGQLAAALRECE